MCLVLHAFQLEEVFTTQVSSIRMQSQDNNSSLFLKSFVSLVHSRFLSRHATLLPTKEGWSFA